MIPTMMLFGLVFGRWWKTALITAAVVWPLLLFIDGALPRNSNLSTTFADMFLAVGLAVVNAAVGVAVHQLILYLVRRARTPE